ncbi:MAG: Uncharacterised protein [Alphaproteobacteria bacterium UBA4588]|nr:MAG: Uncharacterised protein [Alphaproteobacteria bacterium UBA4588]
MRSKNYDCLLFTLGGGKKAVILGREPMKQIRFIVNN